MKLVSYKSNENEERTGIYINGKVVDIQNSARDIGYDMPSEMNEFLRGGNGFINIARKIEFEVVKKENGAGVSDYQLIAPVPHPPSCRDAYAFRQHVAAARRNRGVDMIPEFDQFPIFYFTNHNSITGEGDLVVENDHLHKLDFELEIAAIIGKHGRNIDAGNADSYIAGFTIMNDFSARLLQMEEMKLNLGPAKGKDFATAIGPWLVTTDELEGNKIETENGLQYNLGMKAYHNGELISEGNAKDMTFTFAEIIERASYGVDIFPGDVIGSGTVGTGCYLELNGTRARIAKENGKDYTPVWLENGDFIDLEISGLGRLSNKIVLSNNNISILEKKKM